jgi:hypothetical protein
VEDNIKMDLREIGQNGLDSSEPKKALVTNYCKYGNEISRPASVDKFLDLGIRWLLMKDSDP